jgi:hypothetical protein
LLIRSFLFINKGGNDMREILFCDVCNTIANVNKELEKRGFRTDIYPSPIDKEVWKDNRIFIDAEPIWSVIELLRELSTSYDIIYLTARPTSLNKLTSDWLCRYGLPGCPIVHTNGLLKGAFMRPGVYGIIEDSPHEISSVLQACPNSALYVPDWIYNRHIEPDKGQRISL